MTKFKLIAAAVGLCLDVGCSQKVGPAPARESRLDHPSPTFEFRGYDEYSDCSEIVVADESNGSQITGAEITDGLVSPDIHITAMTVEVYGVQLEAEIRCRLSGVLLHAVYWVNGDDEKESRAKRMPELDIVQPGFRALEFKRLLKEMPIPKRILSAVHSQWAAIQR